MKKPIMHYGGGTYSVNVVGTSTRHLPGWPCCCSGDSAKAIKSKGTQTRIPAWVTCRKCRAEMDRDGTIFAEVLGEQEGSDPGNLVLRAADAYNNLPDCSCPSSDCHSEASVNLSVRCRVGRSVES